MKWLARRLHVLGTERHESRRIDNQLRGRAGRQGDPGARAFIFAARRFDAHLGGERMQNLMLRLGMEEIVPIESKLISKRIASGQKAVEAQNFAAAKPDRVRRRDEQAAPGRVRHAASAAGGDDQKRADSEISRASSQHYDMRCPDGRIRVHTF